MEQKWSKMEQNGVKMGFQIAGDFSLTILVLEEDFLAEDFVHHDAGARVDDVTEARGGEAAVQTTDTLGEGEEVARPV